ncbi:hypothetical protein ABZ725_51615 [Streptomyces sp. NPDC006872]|uniref:hypothetical protein n=1 Tax=Streptomyces sp. NPDC006872 TaxID=3155720 RepID=UPI0033CA51CC
MQIAPEVAGLLREGLSNAAVARRTGLHPVKVADARSALGLPGFADVLPVYVAPDSRRPHGSRAKYVVEKCRCRPCRDANRTRENERSRQIAYGRYESPFVDAGPARAHLLYLRSCGMGLRAIAAELGVGRRYLQSIVSGRPDRGGGAPQKGISPERAAAILAVRPTLDTLAGHAHVSAVGTVRRLQALVAFGWPVMRLAQHIDWTTTNLCALFTATGVTVQTARRIRDLYRELSNTDPRTHGASEAGVAGSKARALKAGWAPPAAWDDDRIDDPDASPDWTGQCGTRAGYLAHRAHEIPPCAPCRDANAAYRRALSTAHA